MGLLRFILAIAVIIAHAGDIYGYTLMGGNIAVKVFFIISGFYMALILNEKYISTNSYKLFITNRLLKLFPLYYTVLTLSIGLGILVFFLTGYGLFLDQWIKFINSMDLGSAFFLGCSNLFILGQDTALFFKFNNNNIHNFLTFTTNFKLSDPALHSFFIIPQAWSLSLEIMFYSIAPFIVRKKTPLLLILMLLSLILRVILIYFKFPVDPWLYRFFPTEIFFFLLGTLSYKIYIKVNNLNLSKKLLQAITIIILVYTLSFEFIPTSVFKEWLYYLIIGAAIPFIFIYTCKNKVDRMLGELSYPIYISHIMILTCSNPVFKILANNSISSIKSIFVIIFTVLFSFGLFYFIIKPIELFRQSRVELNKVNRSS